MQLCSVRVLHHKYRMSLTNTLVSENSGQRHSLQRLTAPWRPRSSSDVVGVTQERWDGRSRGGFASARAAARLCEAADPTQSFSYNDGMQQQVSLSAHHTKTQPRV